MTGQIGCYFSPVPPTASIQAGIAPSVTGAASRPGAVRAVAGGRGASAAGGLKSRPAVTEPAVIS